MTDIAKCSYCNKRKADTLHYLCRRCTMEAPVYEGKVYVPDMPRLSDEPMAAYVQRMRTQAHRGQRNLNAGEHPLIGARVVTPTDVEGVVSSVVHSRFGPLARLDGEVEQAWGVACLTVVG